MQLLQEAAVLVRMRTTDSEGLSRYLWHNHKRKPLFVCKVESAKRVLGVISDRDERLYGVQGTFRTQNIGTRRYFESDGCVDEAPGKRG